MKYIRLLLYLTFFIFLINYSSAFLISPSHYDINFEPNGEKTLIISLINNDHSDIVLETYIKDVFLHPIAANELKNAFSMNVSQVHLKPSEDVVTFAFKIKFPPKLSLNGTHDLRVGAVESAQEGQVAFRAANEVRILIKNGEGGIIVPPPVNYTVETNPNITNIPKDTIKILNIEILGIKADDVYQGDKSQIVTKVKNNEIFDVDVNGMLNMINDKGIIDTISIPYTKLAALKDTNIVAYWDTKLASIGQYNVVGTITYQGGSKKESTTMQVKERSFFSFLSFNMILIGIGILALIIFIIITILLFSSGRKGVEIVSVSASNIFLNSVGDINVKYKNHSNKEFEQCYTCINIKDVSGNIVDTVKNDENNIKPKEEGIYVFGWDTNNVISGIYKLQVIIGYDSKKTEKILEVIL